jgi:hypothetical protein
MSNFKLICDDEAIPFKGASKIKQEFETDSLNIILGNMTTFLQKCGYLSKDQKLDLGREIDFSDIEFPNSIYLSDGTTVTLKIPENSEHSIHYYETTRNK